MSSGTMVPYWKFAGQGIASSITSETGRRAIALAYLPAGLKENQRVRIQSRGKFLEGTVVQRHIGAEIPPYARPIHPEEVPVPQPKPSEPLESRLQDLVKKAQANTRWRQNQTINLIPSEQTPSPLVKLLSVADPCARYAEHRHLKALGEAHVYYYQGTDFIEWVEERLGEEMGRYLGCSEVEARVISGQMANATVFSALIDYLNRFDRKSNPRRLRKVMNHHLGRGGHLSAQPMGALRDFIAVDPQMETSAAINFPVLPENPYQIDLPKTEAYLQQHKPELLVLGKSMILYREPLAQLRRMADQLAEKPLIMYDMAHVLGLYGAFQAPLQEGADVVTGSTHKT
ncbi:MAG: glycine cleavage system protein T, partial [Deltaproteobacteria bacterium]|nr:glycine cleavage system protein T [Deltaproteobacteria bacterium]